MNEFIAISVSLETHEFLKSHPTTREDRPIEETKIKTSPLSHYEAGNQIDAHNDTRIPTNI